MDGWDVCERRGAKWRETAAIKGIGIGAWTYTRPAVLVVNQAASYGPCELEREEKECGVEGRGYNSIPQEAVNLV